MINGFLPLMEVTRISISDVAKVADSLLSLLRELFPRCLSLRHIYQLVTHGEAVGVASLDYAK